jgi:hypothetical protein
VPSAPNTLGRASSYDELTALAASANLGDDLVVQTPYGDSGKTTFFIRGRRDWDRCAKELVEQELKVMKRINCRAAAVEAALTRHGTVVGPLMTDLTGHPELTPHKGGWCGNDIFPGVLSREHLERARTLTQKLGDRLDAEGYRGFVEVDYLADVDTGELYLGEINPRISGVTSMTNVCAGAYADMPLFLFHLLEYMDVDYEVDVDEINERWAIASDSDAWSQLILKDTRDADGAAQRGTSSAGLRSKKPTGLSQKETVSTAITGHSSGRVTWWTPKTYQSTTSASSIGRSCAVHTGSPRSCSLCTTNSPQGQRSSSWKRVTHSVWAIACARRSTGASGSIIGGIAAPGTSL